MRSRVLYVTGHPEDAVQLSQMLQSLPLVLDHVSTLEQAQTQLQEKDYEVVVAEAALADGNWLDVLHLVRAQPGELEVIVTYRQADGGFWDKALNLGAYDLLAQPFSEAEVRRIFYNACCRTQYMVAG